MKCFRNMQIAHALVFLIMAAVMLGSSPIVCAAGDVPYTFSPGETISSSQVNANFQALSTQIAALQAQLAPAVPISQTSVAGIYDYFLFSTGMDIVQYNAQDNGYRFGRTHYQGILVLAGNGTANFNGTGGHTRMEIRSILYQPDNPEHPFSFVSGNLSTSDPTDSGVAPYTVTGSTITVAGGVFVGTLSSDGKMFAGITDSDRGKGIMMGIRRPPAITGATSLTADGYYTAGASISVVLNFSEAVTSTGLTVVLNSGATMMTGAISNVTTWSGTYTVGAGQTSGDLSIGAVTGTIASVFSTFITSNPPIPAGQNIGDSKAIVIQ